MLVDLGAFHKVRPGSDPTLHNALYNVDPRRWSLELWDEVAVAVLTPGWGGPDMWSTIMAWGFPCPVHICEYALKCSVSLSERVQENLATVTREDGLDWLRELLRRNLRYAGDVPEWTKRALRDLKEDRGYCSVREMFEDEFEIGPGQWRSRMQGWASDRR